jgi:CRP/FNR family transcriptional regulator
MHARAAFTIPLHPVPAASGQPKTLDAAPARCPTTCSACGLRELCLPCGLSGADLDRVDQLIYTRRRVKRGDTLYEAGDPFKSLYAVRTGFFKSSVFLENGREQVTAFHMAGDLMGMDGIGADHHSASVVALEDSEVCVILFSTLEQASGELRSLQRQFHKVMSRELVRDQGVMMLLGAMRAEERMATFLLNLSQRFRARGYSQTEFHLRMTREEIGSYLGLKLETVSRIFSRFQEEGLIAVQQKHVQILDAEGLKRILA